MSATFTVLASLALASGAAEADRNLDEESVRLANTLVTAYTCDLLGYGVDYISMVDWGHETREAMMAEGATYDEAMKRMQADVRVVRDRFNATYGTAITASRWAIFDNGITSHGPQGRYMKTFSKRCNRLAKDEVTSAFFTKPESRVSGAELSRKVRSLIVAARHGE